MHGTCKRSNGFKMVVWFTSNRRSLEISSAGMGFLQPSHVGSLHIQQTICINFQLFCFGLDQFFQFIFVQPSGVIGRFRGSCKNWANQPLDIGPGDLCDPASITKILNKIMLCLSCPLAVLTGHIITTSLIRGTSS